MGKVVRARSEKSWAEGGTEWKQEKGTRCGNDALSSGCWREQPKDTSAAAWWDFACARVLRRVAGIGDRTAGTRRVAAKLDCLVTPFQNAPPSAAKSRLVVVGWLSCIRTIKKCKSTVRAQLSIWFCLRFGNIFWDTAQIDGSQEELSIFKLQKQIKHFKTKRHENDNSQEELSIS